MLLYLSIFFIFYFIIIVILFVEMCIHFGRKNKYIYFGFNNVESVVEGWVEAQMSWVAVGGA